MRPFLRCAAAGFLLLGATLCGRAAGPLLLTHYLPWFQAKPYSASWGWHWTMNHFDPDVVGSDGRRAIASWYYPLVGPYDSADPVILEYHALLMKLAGFDGVVLDWYGADDFDDYAANNQRALAFLPYLRKAGLSFCLCYEDATIAAEISGGFLSATNAVGHARGTMAYAATNYFQDPAYLRWRGGPLLLNFGPQYFTAASNWPAIFSDLAPANRPSFFTESRKLTTGLGAFDWPPMWLAAAGGGVLSDARLQAYLNGFRATASAPPAWPYIGAAFPRFHDIYAQAGVGPSYGYLDDAGGATFVETLSNAVTNAALVQVATWNDFGEGTVIEPTVEYGYRDLGVLQDYRRRYVEAGFAPRTNDLALALRLAAQRRQLAANPVVGAELDRVFAAAVGGDLAQAGRRLAAIEARAPAVYGFQILGGAVQFAVGGYLSGPTVAIEAASDLAAPTWRPVGTVAVTTNQVLVTLQLPTGPTAYVRAVNATP